MRASLLSPFLSEIKARGMDAGNLLSAAGLALDIPDAPDSLVTATQVHRFIERVALAAGDRYFCWNLGWSLDHANYPLFEQLITGSTSLSQLLTATAISSSRQATATRFELHVEGQYCQFKGIRTYRPEHTPRHTDAFVLGTLASMVADYAGQFWSPAEVTLELSDPDLIPRNTRLRRVQAERVSVSSIRFPSEWLLAEELTSTPGVDSALQQDELPGLQSFIIDTLKPHLDNAALDAPGAAALCGFSLREIKRHLEPVDQTLANLIDNMRREAACELLENSNRTVAAIGSACGYPDPTSFSRAFRRWTGTSPRNYREITRPPGGPA